MSVPARPFEAMYHDKLTEIKRLFWEYMTSLREAKNPTGLGSAQPKETAPALKLDENGIPIIPSPWVSGNHKKKDLEALYSSFLAQHYSAFFS